MVKELIWSYSEVTFRKYRKYHIFSNPDFWKVKVNVQGNFLPEWLTSMHGDTNINNQHWPIVKHPGIGPAWYVHIVSQKNVDNVGCSVWLCDTVIEWWFSPAVCFSGRGQTETSDYAHIVCDMPFCIVLCVFISARRIQILISTTVSGHVRTAARKHSVHSGNLASWHGRLRCVACSLLVIAM